MSYRQEQFMSLAGSRPSPSNLSSHFHAALRSGMHGLCFSPYGPEQKPGKPIGPEQIRERLEIIRPYTQWIRSFSCTEGNELIPQVAKEMGFQTLVGAWLGKDPDKNREEIENLIQIAKQGQADIVAVGNEVLYRQDFSEADLIDYIQQVKTALPQASVGYVDAYYEFENRPAVTDACDLVLANCYPYWEGCHIDYSLLYMKEMYRRAQKAANGKRVIITESGWPSAGTPFGSAEPSVENAMRYFIAAQEWARQDQIELFYFSSFDEAWKIDTEGDVGAYWGIWDTHGNRKF